MKNKKIKEKIRIKIRGINLEIGYIYRPDSEKTKYDPGGEYIQEYLYIKHKGEDLLDIFLDIEGSFEELLDEIEKNILKQRR